MPYVYIYLDPRKPGHYNYTNVSFLYEPFYVGKGSGNRYLAHIKEVNRKCIHNQLKLNKIKKILAAGLSPFILILTDGDESYILNEEKCLIDEIGRITEMTGPLTNIRPGGALSNYTPPQRKRIGNGREGFHMQTITNGEVSIRVDTKSLSRYIANGWKICEWVRPTMNNTKSRIGQNNPMYGKSAIKGRKWVTLSNGENKLLTADEIKLLNSQYTYGRNVDSNRKKRIIVKNSSTSHYMTDDEIASLPNGTEYQIGLIWKANRKTFII